MRRTNEGFIFSLCPFLFDFFNIVLPWPFRGNAFALLASILCSLGVPGTKGLSGRPLETFGENLREFEVDSIGEGFIPSQNASQLTIRPPSRRGGRL
jgi:hypothetical protein